MVEIAILVELNPEYIDGKGCVIHCANVAF